MTTGLLVGVLLGVAVLVAGGAAVRLPSLPAPLGRVRRREEPDPVDVPLLLELVAAAVEAGLPAGRALERALEAAPFPADPGLVRIAARLSWGADAASVWDGVDARWEPLAEPLRLSAATGAPAAALLRSAADQHRTDRRRAAEEAAARLGSLLVLPLGLCTLPSFLLLGVVPVVLTLAGDLLAGAG